MTISRAYALEHFDEICERAENGEEIVLERPGKPGLRLVAKVAEEHEAGRTAQQQVAIDRAVESIRRMMLARPPLEGVTIRELIEEGRRY